MKARRRTVKRPTPSLVSLHCRHTTLLYPVPTAGELVYCVRCADWRRVTAVVPEWRWHCPHCHYTGRHGTDKDGAVLKATRHYHKHAHSVELWWGDTTVDTIGPSSGQLTMEA